MKTIKSQHFSVRSFSIAFSLFIISLLVSLTPHWRAQGQSGNQVTTVSAASYQPFVAPDSIAVAFGSRLATRTEVASSQPLPTSLAGTTVRVNGELAPLFFVAPNQMNYLIPPGTPAGTATIVVTSGDGVVSNGTAQVATVAPAIFAGNSNGLGVPAALLYRVKANGEQTAELLFEYDASKGQFVTKPIDLGPEGEQVFLALFLTGIRRARDLNGDGNLNETIRVVIGGKVVIPLFAGPQPNFAGLDQVNSAEIPRSLIGRGRVTLSVVAEGFGSSNLVEVEIAGPLGVAPPQVSGYAPATVLARQMLTINGSGFSPNVGENMVRIGGVEARRVLSTTPSQLTVQVPFGVESGPVKVRTPQGEGVSADPIAVRTSISGFIEDTSRRPIIGATLKLRGTNITATTNNEGAFLLPDVPANRSAEVEVNTSTAQSTLPYPQPVLKVRVVANRDNQIERPNSLEPITGPSLAVGASPTANVSAQALEPAAPAGAIQKDGVTFEVPDGAAARFPDGSTRGFVRLDIVANSRTPVNLPAGIFSSTIAQITPFGVTLTPGGKLTFPNTDRLMAGTRATLFRFDQTPNSQTLGSFIPAGMATVSADGQRVETEAGAVAETSYYFVAVQSQTTTVVGRVLDSDGSTPVRRALARARGQEDFTDGNGSFTLRNVAVSPGDTISVEASLQRPDGRIDRAQSNPIPAVIGGITLITPDIVLPMTPSNLPPVISGAPTSLTATENRQLSVSFVVLDPDGQVDRVIPTGANFASIVKGSNDVYTLRLTPASSDVGTYTLTLTATDNQGASSSQPISLRVQRAPTASDKTITTNQDTPVSFTLMGSDPDGDPINYSIVNVPAHGVLSGAAQDRTYTPAAGYSGSDSFTYKVNDGFADSNTATVSIAIIPVNRPPVLTVPGPQTVSAGQTLTFAVSATDPDAGQTLTISATSLPSGASFPTASGPSPLSRQFSWTPNASQVGSYTVSFVVIDNGVPQRSDTKMITITVAATAGLPPVVWSQAPIPISSVSALLVSGATIFAATSANGIYRSVDNGQSWVSSSKGLTNQVSALTANATAIFAAGYGVYRSTDNGQSWTPANNGLSSYSASANIVSITTAGANVYAGSSDGYIFRSTDNGQNWTPVYIDLNAAYIFALAVSGTTTYAGTNGALLRSTDNGQNWTKVAIGQQPDAITSFAINGSTIFAGGYLGVYRSTNNGQNWTLFTNGFPQQSGGYIRVNLLAPGSGFVFAATDYGLFRSMDNGQTWVRINVAANKPVTGVSASALAVSGTTVFVATSYRNEGLYRSTDNGQSWTLGNNGLPSNAYAYALAANGTTVFAGTYGSGVYRSNDSGRSWTQTVTGLTDADLDITKLAASGSTVYAATRGNRIYRSTDNGEAWVRVLSFENQTGITALAATGTAAFAGVQSNLTTKVFRSTDTGQNWTESSLALPQNSIVLSLATTGATVFAGTDAGLFRSTDSGQSWARVGNGVINPYVLAIVTNGDTIFAGTFGGVFRSLDNGQTWLAANSGLGNLFVSSLAANGTIIYAGTRSLGSISNATVFRSTDNGLNWAAVNDGLPVTDYVPALAVSNGTVLAAVDAVVYFAQPNEINRRPTVSAPDTQSVSEGQTLSFAVTAADSDAGQNLTLLARNLPLGATFTSTGAASGQFRWTPSAAQVNGYETSVAFQVFDSGTPMLSDTKVVSIKVTPAQPVTFSQPTGPGGGRVTALAVSGNTIFAGTLYGGVFRSTDNGQSWTQINNGLYLQSVYAIAVSGTTIFLSVGIEGFPYDFYRSTDNGQNWQQVAGCFNVLSIVANGATIFVASQNGFVLRSTDGGQTWTGANIGSNSVVLSLAVDSATIFAGTAGDGVYRSSDNGQSWTRLNNAPARTDVKALLSNSSVIFAGTDSGGIYRSNDSGQTWTQVLSNQNVMTLALSGTSLLAGTKGNGVLRSNDNGQTWPTINNGLGSLNINVLAANNTTIFAGTDKGVFRIANNGQNWVESKQGIANQSIFSLAASGTTVFAGTRQNGVFRSTDGGQIWTETNNGLLGSSGIANIFSLAISGTTVFAHRGDAIYRSTDNGQNWTQSLANTGSPQYGYGICSLAVIGSTIYASGDKVYRSTNNGQSWIVVTGLPIPVAAFTAVGTTIFAGISNNSSSAGTIYRSTDNGQTWTTAYSGSAVYALAISGTTIFAGTRYAGVIRSTDNGQTWVSTHNGLGTNVESLITSGATIFVTDGNNRIFRSTDNGQNWASVLTLNGYTSVSVLAVSGNKLYVGGFGVYAGQF